MAFKVSNLEPLIGFLRVQIGDLTSTPTYTDETLHNILRYAVMALQPRWSDKYVVDVDGVVYRGPVVFQFSSPPVIQTKDYRPIVLMASILIKTGNKNVNSGTTASWKDDEVSYSNIEAAKQRDSTLNDDIKELENLLPSKKLARPLYGRLYGWTADWDK